MRKVLEEAGAVAAAAALGTGLATPLDPGSRVGAALAAAKTAFVGYLAASGLQQLLSQYSIRVTHDTYWS